MESTRGSGALWWCGWLGICGASQRWPTLGPGAIQTWLQSNVSAFHPFPNLLFFDIHVLLRDACAIPDEKTQSVIITGGYQSQRSVKRYNLKGLVEKLPNMITKRQDHGCAGYQQDDKLV